MSNCPSPAPASMPVACPRSRQALHNAGLLPNWDRAYAASPACRQKPNHPNSPATETTTPGIVSIDTVSVGPTR